MNPYFKSKNCKKRVSVWFGRTMAKYLFLLLAGLSVMWPLFAYQWPLPSKQITQGFLTIRPPSNDQTIAKKFLPSLGIWFDIENGEGAEGIVQPYHVGEIIYFETSSARNMLGPIPQNIDNTIIVQHNKLLFRYSGDNLALRLQDSYQVTSDDFLFVNEKQPIKTKAAGKQEKAVSRLYMEIFDTQFQTVINPKLIMPSIDKSLESSELYLESVTLTELEDKTVKNQPMKKSDQVLRGIYNLNFRFPLKQGPPLRLNISIDNKKIYSELFDQVHNIDSRLSINDRDLQDLYILGEKEGRFFLGTINLQDKVKNSVRVSVAEKYVDGSYNLNDYNLKIR